MAKYSTPPMNILDIVWNKLVGFDEIALKFENGPVAIDW